MERRIGIIRERKVPVDRRVAMTPKAVRRAKGNHPDLDLVVERSPVRAFTDAEYEAAGVRLSDDMSDRDLLIGVKEVPVEDLIAGKTYLIFSHTIKKQPHNRKLLQAVLKKDITLLDHELLTDAKGERVLAFGHWAGVVGTYNALRGWNLLHGGTALKPAEECHDLAELKHEVKKLHVAADLRIVMTGAGRVGQGALEILEVAGIHQVGTSDFLRGAPGPVFTMVGTSDLYARNDGAPFDKKAFYTDPSGHHGTFLPYARKASVYLACHFWDPRGPKILSTEDLRDPELSLRVVADISCDVGGPIDSTVRASSIAEPFYGYDPQSGKGTEVAAPGSILVMAVDNLPCALPRDASEAFAQDLLDHVLPALLGDGDEEMIERATIVSHGKLSDRFEYLADYASQPTGV
ncbi:MAG: alanine dehydrogenase [Flavobacteriales bacterium]|nr:alanine dehydrogenase [Flavobacteriales bacterium]MBP6697373.1 alanine dehydrogenase [Flavobacteriales bacterium]